MKIVNKNEFDYDECGQLKTVYLPESGIYINYEYDCFNREIEKKYWNGFVEKTSYNDYGLIETKIAIDSIGQILRCDLLLYNDNGKLQYVFNKDGNYNHFIYSEEGKLQEIDYPYSDELKNFYIADMHFGHKNAIRFDSRPFPDIESMDEYIIQSWNGRVKEDDTVYVLDKQSQNDNK